ncbi:uncharacterized protein EV154DRAFT_532881 [Mucor mucedo]|uniref:uncharacterized protein n=1 Tax=Mucor mucedo TaxID=29922 RepID=UPI00221F433B|nr:uncharacterized protein EV154DRAFT_532881 [Mucor mucedo]KAI7865981.1 hypothetical protein EV154DRAFT_532881 [Mucor mucedo]
MLLSNVMLMGWMLSVNGQWTNKPLVYLGDTPYQHIPVHNMSTALRIQRDIAMNVTLDQFVWPALDISTAFLGNHSLFALPHLPLRMGYKRLIMDLYYDPVRSDWQLCPQYDCSDYLLSHFLKSIDDYLISTQVSGASPYTDIVTLVFHLQSLTPNLTITSNLASLFYKVSTPTLDGKTRVYTPSNLTTDTSLLLTHRQEPYFMQDETWPQWIHLIQNKAQLLLALGNVSSNIIISDLDKETLFRSLGNTTHNIDSLNCSAPTSWSFVSDRHTPFSYTSAFNATQCGYSPVFTQSQYPGELSLTDPGHLSDNILSTLWSWDINEPNTQNGAHRCAAMEKNGRWYATDCAQSLAVACYSPSQNHWLVLNVTSNYDRSLSECPETYFFDVPRVPRQNLQLQTAMQGANVTGKVWLNLNMVYNQDMCWAVGRYGTCWWSKDGWSI